jgi:hypothetical protein
MAGKTNNDVKFLFFYSPSDVSFIPKGMEIIFPNFMALHFERCNIAKLNGDELRNYRNLEWFGITFNPLENLPQNFFANNPKLRILWMHDNQIKHVGVNLLSSLQQLQWAQFHSNICVHKTAGDHSQVPALTESLNANCSKTCYDTTKTVCDLKEQNQILIENNSAIKYQVGEINQKVNILSQENLEIKDELKGLSKENAEMKEILVGIMHGILDLTSRPCGG